MAKILKSTLIGGFRKKDVIEYLEELNLERQKEQAQQEKEQQALADTIAELHGRLEERETALQEAEAAAASLQTELEQAAAEQEILNGKLETAAAALEESKAALEQQLADRQALQAGLEEKEAALAQLEARNAQRETAEQELRDRLAASEAERAALQNNLQTLAAQLSRLEADKQELTAENEKLRQPVETAKRVAEAVPELVRSAVDAVPDSVKQNLADTAETAKRKVVAIHRKVSEWGQKQAQDEPVQEEEFLVDTEMAPEEPAPEYKAQTEPLTPEALLEKCKTRLGEVAREFNDLYQAVVKLEDKEQQAPAQSKSKLGHLSSIKEILDRVRSLGEKK